MTHYDLAIERLKDLKEAIESREAVLIRESAQIHAHLARIEELIKRKKTGGEDPSIFFEE